MISLSFYSRCLNWVAAGVGKFLPALVVLPLIVACGGGSGNLPVTGVERRALDADFLQRQAVNYAPFRSNNQDTESVPKANIEQDLRLVSRAGFGLIRLFTSSDKVGRQTLDVIRDRRPKYGGPRQHFRRTVGMINAAFGEILRRPLTEADWAVIMTLDKVARYMGPNKTEDGPIDLAGYAACLAECEAPGD